MGNAPATRQTRGSWLRQSMACMALAALALLPGTPALAGASAIRAEIEALWAQPVPTVAGERVHRITALRRAYESLDYAPLWTPPASRGRLPALLAALRSATDHGLDPDHYHLGTLERLARRGERTTEVELLASDAFLHLGIHLGRGKTTTGELQRPAPSGGDWRRAVDALARVADFVAPRRALAELRPPSPMYDSLQRRLRELQSLARHEPRPVARGPVLEPGDEHPRVLSVRRRLWWLGDLRIAPAESARPARFDDHLAAVLRRFQRRHGLVADGIVGPRTLRALNRSADARIRRLRANLERLRWLPAELSARRVIVNIADFRMRYAAPGREALDMRAIVGEPYSQTPVLASRIDEIVLNPSWWVPNSIATEELLPRLQRNAAAMERQGFVALPTGGQGPALRPTEVDWAQYSPDHFPFRLRQNPGRSNALGRVKFRFPNPYAVYLHDTPQRHLFHRTGRTFSHGCIRLERALSLAERLLETTGTADRDAVAQALRSGETTRIDLADPVPVYLVYLTAWADGGTIHWRDDVYDRDRPVLRALAGRSVVAER